MKTIVPTSSHTKVTNRLIASVTDSDFYHTGGLTIDFVTGFHATWGSASAQYVTRLNALIESIERFKTDVQLKEIEDDERYAFAHVWAHGVQVVFTMLEQMIKARVAPTYVGSIASGAGGVYYSTDEVMQLLDELEYRGITILSGVVEFVTGINPIIVRGIPQATRYWPPAYHSLWQNDTILTTLNTYISRMEIYALQAKSYCAKLGINYKAFSRGMLTVKTVSPTDVKLLQLTQVLPVYMQGAAGAAIWLYFNNNGSEPTGSATWYQFMDYLWPGDDPDPVFAAMQLLANYDGANNVVGCVVLPSNPLVAAANNTFAYYHIGRTATSWSAVALADAQKLLEIHPLVFQDNDAGAAPQLTPENGGTPCSIAYGTYGVIFQGWNLLPVSTNWMEATNYSALKDFYSVLMGFIKLGKQSRPSRKRSPRRGSRKKPKSKDEE
uniref:Uncharacterized protein n=1 Tax=viral metagenome TaxID=1070528 RepID=A0A2V0R9E8_9ZZZZ